MIRRGGALHNPPGVEQDDSSWGLCAADGWGGEGSKTGSGIAHCKALCVAAPAKSRKRRRLDPSGGDRGYYVLLQRAHMSGSHSSTSLLVHEISRGTRNRLWLVFSESFSF